MTQLTIDGTDEYCKHCSRPIIRKKDRYWVHSQGIHIGKVRCDTSDTNQPYGFCAEPVWYECEPPCRGAM